jgi:hypothetical protein
MLRICSSKIEIDQASGAFAGEGWMFLVCLVVAVQVKLNGLERASVASPKVPALCPKRHLMVTAPESSNQSHDP